MATYDDELEWYLDRYAIEMTRVSISYTSAAMPQNNQGERKSKVATPQLEE